ncbi:microtubule nucleation factor SSNA1 [Amia ocellicauda]|uniref:microtubule nucleation factor SSNA1 n=1 Tax=Amia ocellicauda TaxID=2972642 RepID=UPI003463ED1E
MNLFPTRTERRREAGKLSILQTRTRSAHRGFRSPDGSRSGCRPGPGRSTGRMTQQGAALQTYNNELVKCIEELCLRRDELNRQVQLEEEEKRRLQSDIGVLTEKLGRLNESLARKMAARNDFDRTIAETEAAYMKILESSQTLLSVLKRETGNLSKVSEPRGGHKDH